ncbi:MAG: ribonuclease Z [Flavobacteriales bacterium]|nr:ribonuclease Z [Flavobacteriales bacterium]
MANPTFSVTALGSSSSMPTAERNLSGHFVNIAERFYLVDCGEGTQFQLIKFKLKYQKINHIFITHMHGDHFFGLLGLLSSLHLLGRTREINIYGPPDLGKVFNTQNQYAAEGFSYQIVFHALGFKGGELVYENKVMTVTTIKLKHRVPCNGFLFREKQKPRKLLSEAISKYGIPEYERNNIKLGKDFTMESGEVITNDLMTADAEPPRSFAYCSDTIYSEKIIEHITKVDLLYHEATFKEDMLDRAKETYHTTASQAASIASQARVGRLLLGHFSTRYKELDSLLEEAKTVFENTELIEEGKTYDI